MGFETTVTADQTAATDVGAPALTFDDASRAIGSLGGEPRTGARFAVHNAAMRALISSGTESFAEAFRFFEAERLNWQRELAEAPPRVVPGAHVFDMPEGADKSELRERPAGQSTSRRDRDHGGLGADAAAGHGSNTSRDGGGGTALPVG